MFGQMNATLLVLFTSAAFLNAAEVNQTLADGRRINGPLRVHPQNPRYFTDDAGRAVFLTGSHTWNSLQDMGETDPPAPFDFGAYLEFLARHNHNFIRLWRWELPTWDTKANGERKPRRIIATPHPWVRSGPGQAFDGKAKFNLDQFDDAYFQRLRSRVTAARDKGVYVSIMLFEGWGLRFLPDGWSAHPFHPSNNVNHTEAEVKPGVKGIGLFSLGAPKVTAQQEAYVRKVIDTVNDLDNVLYEIANESDYSTTEWQYHFIRFIKNYEARKPRQHPVGMTSIGFGNGVDDLDRLLKGPADWISPNPGRYDYKTDPAPADGAKVILPDTDHLWGVGGDVHWVWKSFLRGLNPIFMDPYRREVLDRGPDEQWEPVRRAMGVARRLADKVNLVAMKPDTRLASTGYCLANPGNEYLVYLRDGDGELRIDLTAATGSLSADWIDPVSGETMAGRSVQGGAVRTFSRPEKRDWVLYVHRP